MRPCDLEKNRDIRFNSQPAGQAARAIELLDGMQGLTVLPNRYPNRLTIHYNVCEYTLAGLEAALVNQGFCLDQGLIARFKRVLSRFCENVQRLNVAANEPDIKSQKAFVKAYEHHLHGDRDDTPEEWREYK